MYTLKNELHIFVQWLTHKSCFMQFTFPCQKKSHETESSSKKFSTAAKIVLLNSNWNDPGLKWSTWIYSMLVSYWYSQVGPCSRFRQSPNSRASWDNSEQIVINTIERMGLTLSVLIQKLYLILIYDLGALTLSKCEDSQIMTREK